MSANTKFPLQPLVQKFLSAAEELDVASEFYVSDHAWALPFAVKDSFGPMLTARALYEGRKAPPNALTWLRIGTESRIAWGQHLPTILEALRGEAIAVCPESSWRWDWSRRTKTGAPRYVPQYQLFISTRGLDKTFDPAPLVRSIRSTVCLKPHPLQDQCLFQWLDDQGHHNAFQSYEWNAEGLAIHCESRAHAERLKVALFAGWETQLERISNLEPAFKWRLLVPAQTLNPLEYAPAD